MPEVPTVKASMSLDRKPRNKRAEGATQRAKRKRHANSRTALQRTGDLAFLTKWRLRGLTLDALIEKINEGIIAAGRPRLSRSQVAMDLKAVDVAWREQRQSDITVLRDRELAKLDADESELQDAWDKSKRPTGKKFKQVTRDGTVDAAGIFSGDEKTVQGFTESESYGDPAIMAQILRIREIRAKLCGWTAAVKVQHSGHDGGALPVGAGAAPIINITIAAPPPPDA